MDLACAPIHWLSSGTGAPWFLVRAGKLDQAKGALQRLSASDQPVDHDATIALMVHTDNIEKEEQAGVSYWDALKGTNLHRTEIGCLVYLAQITSGSPFAYSGTFFYEQTGLSANTSYASGLAGSGDAWFSTMISWLYLTRWGRRDIFLGGLSLLTTVLFLIGILACVHQTESVSWVQSILCLIWLAGYSMSIGPIVFTIVSETGSTRLRTQTVVIGRSIYYVGNIVAGVLEPYFMSPTARNARGKTVSLSDFHYPTD